MGSRDLARRLGRLHCLGSHILSKKSKVVSYNVQIQELVLTK